MDEEGYRIGTNWGCAVAMVVCFPVFLILLLAEALGDCGPSDHCDKSALKYVLLPTVSVGILLFFGVRLLVRWWRRFRDG